MSVLQLNDVLQLIPMHPCARSSSFSLFAAVQLALLLSLLSYRSAQAQLLQEKSFRTSNMAQKEKWLLASGVLLVGFAVDRPVKLEGDLFSLYAAICRTFWEGIWYGRFTGLFGYAHLAQIGKPVRRLLVWGVHWSSAILERMGSR